MGFAIAGSQNSTILGEFALAEAGAEQEVEGLTTPQEIEGEIDQQGIKEGMLRGESKSFTFIKQQGSDLPRRLSDSLFESNKPVQHKLGDPKSALHHLSFKEKLIKEKVFTTVKSSSLEKQPSDQTRGQNHSPLLGKAHKAAHQALKEGHLPPSAARIREGALKQQQNGSRMVEQRVHKELSRKEAQGHQPSRRSAEERGQSRAERPSTAQAEGRFDKNLDKNEERDQKRERDKREEEEGFGGDGQRQSSQEDSSEGKYTPDRASGIDEAFAKEFNSYAAEESILSQIFNMRVSQFDVLVLFIELMKLDLKNRELQKLFRREEREMQIMHMQQVVDNYKEQSKWQLFANLGAGVMAIVSGLAPIAGHLAGDWIMEKARTFMDLGDMEKEKFFKMVTKVTFAMSEMQKSTGQIQNTFSEGHRTFDEHMSQLYRADWEESTRTMDEIKDNWKGIENFLYQTLQMNHEAIRALYN